MNKQQTENKGIGDLQKAIFCQKKYTNFSSDYAIVYFGYCSVAFSYSNI
ncbi:hypothetical protein IPL68_00970 [Candidatus Saccharibacteria bacterium]|nr:MAG: hypothetical protein IPL68_00970 [Candidatus Saccharibacteria bacterium]